MSGNPKPIVAPGTYLIDIASLTVDQKTRHATISNPKYGVEATFTPHTQKSSSDKKVQDFTFQDPTTKRKLTGSYDYSWGNKAVNGFIIGNGSGGYYIITSAVPGSSSSTINGDDLIDPSHARYTYVNDPSRNWSTGNYFILQLDGEYYIFQQDNNGTATSGSLDNEQFTFNTCFLAGSLIRTPSGYRKVEELRRGDMIMTYDPATDQTLPQPLTWAGRSRVRVNPSFPLDMAGYPIRIRKDALAENIPSADLLLTAEHCLFLDGSFVPARMMVNGSSIHYETSDVTCQTSYDIFHVETKQHSIIFANDVMTESYLDTGNRDQFMQPSNDNIPNDSADHEIPSRKQSWSSNAAAPLRTTQDFVAPLHHDCLDRARKLGFPTWHPYKADTVSDDAGFHLVTDKGDILHKKRTSSGYWIFPVPLDAEYLVLMSRAGRPCDVHGPFIDDRRLLGLLVGEIQYFRGAHSTTIDTHLTAEKLDGWHGLEAAPMRWTQGAAMLPLPGRQEDGTDLETALIAIRVVAAGPYPMMPDHTHTEITGMIEPPVLSNVG